MFERRCHISRFCVLLTALAVCLGCSREPIYRPDPSDAPGTTPLVTVLYDPGALGDMTYNDLIFEGVERAAFGHGIRTRQYAPRNQEEGLSFLSGIFDQMSDPADTVRQLLVIAGSSYDDYVRANNRRLEANPRADLLYFETKVPLEGKGSSVHIRTYGAMYEAGAFSPLFANQVLLVAANPYDVADAIKGFQAGFQSEFAKEIEYTPYGERTLTIEYLSDQPGEGFSIDDASAIHLLYDQPWQEGFTGLIVPLCGGASGVFRRLAEGDNYFSILGIDKEILSTACQYATVKHADQVAELCIDQWMSETGLPKHQSLGLDEYYCETVFCPAEPEDMGVIIDLITGQRKSALRKEAIQKEAEYENL